MNLSDIKAALQIKTMEFEAALDKKVPYEELKEIYSELKELQYERAQSELSLSKEVA